MRRERHKVLQIRAQITAHPPATDRLAPATDRLGRPRRQRLAQRLAQGRAGLVEMGRRAIDQVDLAAEVEQQRARHTPNTGTHIESARVWEEEGRWPDRLQAAGEEGERVRNVSVVQRPNAAHHTVVGLALPM